MKKRNHTYQIEGQLSRFKITPSSSKRSVRNRYNSLRPSTHSAPKQKETQELAEGASVWINEEPDTIAIADELSASELTTFSFRCIETMASLANFDQGQTVTETLQNLIRENLPAFVTLIDEHQVAKNEHQEYKTWNKQFISNVQPLIEQQAGPANEVAQLTEQAVHCVEHSLFTKHKMTTLASRIECLIESIPAAVEQTGTELQLPAPVMAKLANQLKLALISLAQ